MNQEPMKLPPYLNASYEGDDLFTGDQVRELLAKQKQGEPVAIHQYRSPHCSDWYDGIPDHHDGHGPYEVRTLYTTPQPKREWVGLTDEEIFETHKQVDSMQYLTFGKAIEAKLKEKNT